MVRAWWVCEGRKSSRYTEPMAGDTRAVDVEPVGGWFDPANSCLGGFTCISIKLWIKIYLDIIV